MYEKIRRIREKCNLNMLRMKVYVILCIIGIIGVIITYNLRVNNYNTDIPKEMMSDRKTIFTVLKENNKKQEVVGYLKDDSVIAKNIIRLIDGFSCIYYNYDYINDTLYRKQLVEFINNEFFAREVKNIDSNKESMFKSRLIHSNIKSIHILCDNNYKSEFKEIRVVCLVNTENVKNDVTYKCLGIHEIVIDKGYKVSQINIVANAAK